MSDDEGIDVVDARLHWGRRQRRTGAPHASILAMSTAKHQSVSPATKTAVEREFKLAPVELYESIQVNQKSARNWYEKVFVPSILGPEQLRHRARGEEWTDADTYCLLLRYVLPSPRRDEAALKAVEAAKALTKLSMREVSVEDFAARRTGTNRGAAEDDEYEDAGSSASVRVESATIEESDADFAKRQGTIMLHTFIEELSDDPHTIQQGLYCSARRDGFVETPSQFAKRFKELGRELFQP